MNILTTIKHFFKKPNPKYTKNLMYIQDGKIHFKQTNKYVVRAETALHCILIYNHIYEDKSYYRLFREYQANYTVYDAYPILLYCKIPIILAADYADLHMPDTNKMLELMIPTLEELNMDIDPKLMAPQFLIKTLDRLYDKVSYYFMPDRVIPKDHYLRLIKYNYLKEWDFFWYNSKKLTKDNKLSLYLSSQNAMLMKMGGSDNFNTIKNIIDRYLEEEIEKESNKNANFD